MKIGDIILELEETESTNKFAAELIKKKDISPGTLIKTKFQKSGKGHFDSVWESEKGKNLLVSFILFPEFLEIERHFLLSKFVSLAICKYVRHFEPNTFIKWPNDIFCNDKKICGILIENKIQQTLIKSSIVGIGLNINQEEFLGDFTATSLKIEKEKKFEIEDVLSDLMHYLNREYKILHEKRYDEIDKDYLENLYNFEKIRTYKDERELFKGKIIGIEYNGELLIQDNKNTVRKYSFKEVALVS